MRQFLVTCLAVALILMAFRSFQETKVSGFVRDVNGKPIEGVTVKETQIQKTTQTAIDGSFSLIIPGPAISLYFQKAGYLSLRLKKLNYKEPLNIVLQDKAQTLNETVDDKQINTEEAVGRVKLQSPDLKAESSLAGSVSGICVSRRKVKSPRPAVSNFPQQQFGTNDFNTEEYDGIVENRFLTATENPFSTFRLMWMAVPTAI